jgi:thymidylate synthase (FAD)
MKLIKASAQFLDVIYDLTPGQEQCELLQIVHKQIERTGRTCYKSEDKITDDSSQKFVDMLINRGHTAMLEHGAVYLKIPIESTSMIHLEEWITNPYSKTTLPDDDSFLYVSTNLRVLLDNNWMNDLQYICKPEQGWHELLISVRFICDKGVSHELVRHRAFSFAQESTRYYNYSKDKHQNQITYIIPCWIETKEEDGEIKLCLTDDRDVGSRPAGIDEWYDGCDEIESRYLSLVNECKWEAQQARAILPNSLKTEVIMTGFHSEWIGKTHVWDKQKLEYIASTDNCHQKLREMYDNERYAIHSKGFFPLRTATTAHEQMQEVALSLLQQFEERDLIPYPTAVTINSQV